VAAGVCALVAPANTGDAADAPGTPPAGAAILEDLRSFRELGSVLYIAAHPDDENNQLLAYLARGRDYRTAYLSLNRGEGGQNELGPEFGEQLGVIRTQESLAARSVDGARQFFSRAFDFGYSKSYEETLRIWDKDEVLADMVRVIREFRPDVLVTRFSPIPGGTHGHHTASTILAQEAFKISGDPKAYPEQIAEGLLPWQPKRLLYNSGGGGGAQATPGAAPANTVRINTGGNDPVTGESFASIAARARSNHKTQGFDNTPIRANNSESFQLLDGAPATTDILDGVDTTWGRYPNGGTEIGQLTDDAIAKFNPQDPSASVPALLDIRLKLSALPKDPVVEEKRALFDRILQKCLGLHVETTIPDAEVVPGEELKMHSTALVLSNVPVKWVGTRYPGVFDQLTSTGSVNNLLPNTPGMRNSGQILPANTPLTTPYWLRVEGTGGMLRVDDDSLIGRPDNPPVYPLEQVFEVGGQTLVIPDEPVQVITDPPKGETRRKLDVIAPVSLQFASEVQLFAPGAAKPVEIDVTAYRPVAHGTLQLNIPADWKVAPASQTFKLNAVGDQAKLIFTVTAPAKADAARITAAADINGAHFDAQRIVLKYAHIPLQLLQPPARLKVVSLDLAIRGSKVGYLPGAGDSIPAALAQMGYAVTTLTGADLTPEKLHGFDAVVIGVRAFNERTDLAANLPGLFAYVEAGGTVVAQYNRPTGLRATPLGPFALSIAGNAPDMRVTDENSPVQFLAPDHPALNTPNKISAADFDGWVQERGAYFPSSWDTAHYTPLLAMSDPGETQPSSSILVVQDGKGYFIYTSLAWFRQLPAGVPGAYRLFANLVSLGK
jgi:LmbE family N-acetylglucosaminyl deacetylase